MQEASTSFARAVGEDGARALVPFFTEALFEDGEVLFREGVASSHLIFVTEGRCRITFESDGVEFEVATLGPGSWLGEVGLIDRGPATATVVADGIVRALSLDHLDLVRLTDEHPEVAAILLPHVTRQLAERLARGSAGILEVLGPGHVRLRKPAEVRTWVGRLLGRLLGGAS